MNTLRCAPGLLLVTGLLLAARPCAADQTAPTDPGTAALIGLLPQLDDVAAQADILKGVRAGLQGQRQLAPPANWPSIYRDFLSESESEEVRQLARLLALQFGDEDVRAELLLLLEDEAAPLTSRRDALTALLEIRASDMLPRIHGLLSGSALRPDALRALAEFSNAETAAEIVQAYSSFDLEEKRTAIDVLSSGIRSANVLLDAVQRQTIPRTDLNAETIRRLRLLNDSAIDEAITAHWGTIRQTPQAKAEQIAELKTLLQAMSAEEADLPHGRAVFAKTCRQCHTLYGDGENVGPEITGTNRADLDYLLVNVVDPNSTVGRDYQAWSVMTDTGKLHVGLLTEETDQLLKLRTETDTITIPTAEIEYRELTPVSMMPEGLFDQLTQSQLRDLVSYLRDTRQVPMLATPDTAGLFYNGRDLTTWTVSDGNWQVSGNAIHATSGGTTDPQAELTSQLLLDEFTLDLECRLTSERGTASVLLMPYAQQSKAGPLAQDPDDPPLRITLSKDIHVRLMMPGVSQEQVQHFPAESSSVWQRIQIIRDSSAFNVAINGVQLGPFEHHDSTARYLLRIRWDGDSDGSLAARNLKLKVPESSIP